MRLIKCGLLSLSLMGAIASVAMVADGIAEIPERSMVSKGTVGLYFQCDHGLALIPEDHNGHQVYRVIETP